MEVIAFPDVEEVVRSYLESELPTYGVTASVHTSIPKARPSSFVTVARVGGPRRNRFIDAATLAVECWDARPKPAHDLAQTVRALINALPGRSFDGHVVNRVDEFAGPGNLPDVQSTQSRYTATYSVHIRGRALTP